MHTLQATSLPIMFSPKNKQYTGLELTFFATLNSEIYQFKICKAKTDEKMF